MKLKEMLKEKEEKRATLLKKSNESNDIAEVRNIHTQLGELNKEIEELRSIIEETETEAEQREQREQVEQVEARQASQGAPSKLNPLGTYGLGEARQAETSDCIDYEQRGKDLLEKRSVTMGSSSIIAPQHQATDIKPGFNQVSSLVDRVTIKPLQGGESYKRPYVKGYGEGTYTAEGAAASNTEPEFGYADINKAKITSYAEDTEEVEKLPAANYAQEVENGMRIAVRRKISAEILNGDGTTNHLMGIFNSTVIEATTDLEVSNITADTLDEIVFSYGGDEDVEDAAVLILSKKDLKAFSMLRATNGEKLHKIVSNGNTGTIDTIPYIINSACKSIGEASQDDYCMAYGSLSNYELAVFSDVEVKKSTDYKFKEGMIAHRGVTFVGGNVAAHNGFLRVKKA